jgi:phosphoribosylanthranilate isomerase
MALKTKVKAGTITNLSDARYCAGMGVDMLGFSVDGNQAISFEKFKEINGWVTGPEIVLEISSPSDLNNLLTRFFGQYIELNASLIHLLPALNEYGIIARCKIDEWENVKDVCKASGNQLKFVLIENYSSADSKALQEIASQYAVLIELKDSSLDLDDLLKLPIEGIAVSGSEEVRPGLKDYEQLAAVLEKLEED